MWEKVTDSRNRRLRGLWRRNGAFYAQIRPPGSTSAIRIRLEATTPAAALVEMNSMKQKRTDGELEIERKRGIPRFTEMADAYLSHLKAVAKNQLNYNRISSSVDSLKSYFAETSDKPVNQIIMGDAHTYAAWRKAHPRRRGWESVSGRAIDLDIIAFRHVMDYSRDLGHVKANPIGKWKALAEAPKEVRLMPTKEVEQLMENALTLSVHFRGGGQAFADYLTILATSGGREKETLRLRWSVNVDWANKRLGFGQDGLSKRGKSRWVQFNPRLESKLKDMFARRDPAIDCLFPTPRPGACRDQALDRPVVSYKNALVALKKKCGTLGTLGFHHFRHYFISKCCMSGVDIKTCQEWVGHEDLDLIARVYAHLTDNHKLNQAAKFDMNAGENSR